MVHSTWGDWFVREEIEATDPDGASLWYLGCNAFVLRSAEATIYIDPYFDDGQPPWVVRMIPVPMDPADATLCDAVCVTHEHIDHFHPPSYGPLTEELGADLYVPGSAFEEPDYEGDVRTPEDQRHVIGVGDEFAVGDFTIHVRGANDPDAIEPLSYVVEHDSGTFFHGGDSKPAEEFLDIGEEFDIDLGVLAFGTVGHIHFPEEGETKRTRWYMDENQVIEAANDLRLDRLLPSHYDMWRGVGADPKVLHEHAASHDYPRIHEPIAIGDRVDFDRAGIVRSNSLR
ncbi:MBL fold metallo-hydrolase [Natronorarus salvus]|uniref:MBL fold metallo-hydrolase n=1 Tax=Natronorarus salvus TaxID=3117733 RepID=UPI002F26A56F